MEKMEFKTKSQLAQEHFHEYLENKLKTDGYSKIESDLYFKFEEYINSRLATIEITMSMVANGIALQKDTGVALLRELPNDETFTILFNGVEQTVSRDEYIVYLEHKAVEAVANGIPVLPYEYSYLFKQAPSLNRVMKSSGEYPVELVAMMLQKNANSNAPELVCLFSTITNDIFSYRFRKNNKYDMFTPNYNSTFEVKDKANIGKCFMLRVAPSRNSGLLRIIDMIPLASNDESSDRHSAMEETMTRTY